MDFEAFYQARRSASADPGDVQVLSADGKGIVMRPEALRQATATAAAREHRKLDTRLSQGEKKNRKRMAEIGAVYDLKPVPRRPETYWPEEMTPKTRPRHPRRPTSGAPPAWSTTPPR